MVRTSVDELNTMKIPTNPHDRLFRFFAAISPTPDDFSDRLRRHDLDELLLPAELAAYHALMSNSRPPALAAWLSGERTHAAPSDEETLAWMENRKLLPLYRLIVLGDEPANYDLAAAWNIFLTPRLRFMIEALTLTEIGYSSLTEKLPALEPKLTTGIWEAYHDHFHHVRLESVRENDSWICRVEKRAEDSTVFQTEARTKRMAILNPCSFQPILVQFFHSANQSLLIPDLISEIRHRLTSRMLTELSTHPTAETLRNVNMATAALERLERFSPEPIKSNVPKPQLDMTTPAGVKLLHINDLRAAGLMAENRGPFYQEAPPLAKSSDSGK